MDEFILTMDHGSIYSDTIWEHLSYVAIFIGSRRVNWLGLF